MIDYSDYWQSFCTAVDDIQGRQVQGLGMREPDFRQMLQAQAESVRQHWRMIHGKHITQKAAHDTALRDLIEGYTDAPEFRTYRNFTPEEVLSLWIGQRGRGWAVLLRLVHDEDESHIRINHAPRT